MVGNPIELHHVTKRFGDVTVVDDLSFTVKEGEILGLLGPNGAGKSTTINLINAVLPPDTGNISVCGQDVSRESLSSRRMVGTVHQDLVIEQYLPIGKALEIHSGYYGIKDDPTWRQHLIDRLEMKEFLHKRFIRLSGGMKRRFMIAKALLHKPKLLILDEPTAGVDIELRQRLWEFIREMNSEGLSILFTTHYLEEAERLCERIVILQNGKLVANEATSELISSLGEQKLIVKAADAPRELPTELSEGALSWRIEGDDEWSFTVATPKELQQLLQRVLAQGWSIEDLKVTRPGLEDVFYRLVRE